MGMDKTMIVAGVGFRKGATAASILAAVAATRTRYAVAARDLAALAVIARKSAEPGLVSAARALALDVRPVEDDALELVKDRLLTRSDRSVAATGLGSASEAAALAAAGRGSRLLGPRLVVGSVTCAVAASEDAS